MFGMQVRCDGGFERAELVTCGFDIHVVDADGFDADILDVGADVRKVADGVGLNDLGTVIVEEDCLSGF